MQLRTVKWLGVLALTAMVSACMNSGDTKYVPVPDVSALQPGGGSVSRSAHVEGQYQYKPAHVSAPLGYAPETIVVDTHAKYLYYVHANGRTATRFGIGVPRPGLEWSGNVYVGKRVVCPFWAPTENMMERNPEYRQFKDGIEGCETDNPLGSRALYLYNDNYADPDQDKFRIHGTRQEWTLGEEVSSGCIRMWNDDLEHFFEVVAVGTPVVVL